MFRKSLVQMFQSLGLDCVFLETHRNPKKRMHMLYECVPLPRELGDMAPIYFKVTRIRERRHRGIDRDPDRYRGGDRQMYRQIHWQTESLRPRVREMESLR